MQQILVATTTHAPSACENPRFRPLHLLPHLSQAAITRSRHKVEYCTHGQQYVKTSLPWPEPAYGFPDFNRQRTNAVPCQTDITTPKEKAQGTQVTKDLTNLTLTQQVCIIPNATLLQVREGVRSNRPTAQRRQEEGITRGVAAKEMRGQTDRICSMASAPKIASQAQPKIMSVTLTVKTTSRCKHPDGEAPQNGRRARTAQKEPAVQRSLSTQRNHNRSSVDHRNSRSSLPH